MVGANALTRRAFVAAIPALGLASPLAAWTMASTSSETKPVLHIAYVGSAAEAKVQVAAARRASGCLRADAYAGSDGRFAIFQTWVSERAETSFNGEGTKPTPALKRLKV